MKPVLRGKDLDVVGARRLERRARDGRLIMVTVQRVKLVFFLHSPPTSTVRHPSDTLTEEGLTYSTYGALLLTRLWGHAMKPKIPPLQRPPPPGGGRTKAKSHSSFWSRKIGSLLMAATAAFAS